MLDYHKMYQIPTVVLRMSCIYGNRQFGVEAQGWLAHFMFAMVNKKPITIYGDGTQVRDVLYIEDYVDLCKKLIDNKDRVAGRVFNIGGGDKNTVSVSRAVKLIGNEGISYADWRPADQHTYISDITKIQKTIGWEPKVGVEEGLQRLEKWVRSQK
jgi:CDP-paratose 2-epimerase